MTKVTYVQPDGSLFTCELAPGESVMDGALDNGIPGILAQCGGACTCATCHCYLLAPSPPDLPPAGPDELELLEYVVERLPESRLACQIRPHGTGPVRVGIPARQA
jgi:2Fe-2S ferredoxin